MMKSLNWAFVGTMGLAALLASPAHAEREGHGGISARINGQTQLLDLIEAKPFKVSELGEFESLRQTLNQMRAYNQTLADFILRAIEKQEIYFYFTPFDIRPTQDADSLVDFEEVQEAAQRGQVVLINEHVWQEADEIHHKSTIVHEILVNRHPKADRMMLRRVVDRIVRGDFGDEESFTHFLHSMGFDYPAGYTPLCRAAFSKVDALVDSSIKAFETWVHSPEATSSACLNSKESYLRKLKSELMQFLPSSYCSNDLLLVYHKMPWSRARLAMTTECLVTSLGR